MLQPTSSSAADVLEEVHVKDLALIREAWLELGPGLNVLSGETGAGKTVIVGALQLLVGERGDSTMVRSGAPEALVEGRFVVEGGERAVRRRLTSEGRSKCYLDEGMATVGELANELGPLVDLHGQHDHQALLRPAAHAGYLMRFAGEAAERTRDEYARAFRAASTVRDELAELESALADRSQQVDLLSFQHDEIARAAPSDGEDADLEAALPRMRHAERLSEAASEAFRALRDDEGAGDTLARAVGSLEATRGVDDALDAIGDRIQEAAVAIDDAGAALRDYADGLEHDPRALNDLETRLALLADLKRKYGPTLSDVIRTRDQAAERLVALGSGDERLASLREAVAQAKAALAEAAKRFAAEISAAVPGFVERLHAACLDLEMGAARFDVATEMLSEESWAETTPLRVEFLFSSSEGDAPRPLTKVASGGEVSRVMLALKSVLGGADRTPVLVFDEIDAGVGGATAIAVGRRLAEIADGRQVVVVTHLAQVAAFADRHLVVSKVEESDGSVTVVDHVEGEDRLRELARMLSGRDTETSLAHARELVETAGPGGA